MKKIISLFSYQIIVALSLYQLAQATGTMTINYSLGTITIASATVVAGGPNIVQDTQTYSASDASNGSPCTWSMNVGNGASGSNRAVFLACAGQGGVPVPIGSASFGGVALSRAKTVQQANSSSEIWYTTGTTTGSQTVSVTPSAGTCGAGNGNVDCEAYSMINVNQTAPIDISTGSVQTSGTIASSTATLTGTTDVIIDAMNMGTTGSTMTPNTGQTGYFTLKNTNQGFTEGSSLKGPLSVGGSQFMTWTTTSGGTGLIQAVVAIQKAP